MTKTFSGGASFTSGLMPGDIILLEGAKSYSYLYLGQINGTADNPIIIKTDGNGIVNMSAGITLENCNYIHVDGGVGYGIKITCQPNQGVPFVIKGKSNHIEVNGIEAMGGVGGLWAKTDVQDVQNVYGCDQSYLYPNHMDDIKLHDNYFHDIQGDIFYLGETDPYGTTRQITCGGKTWNPRPQGLSNFLIYNNKIENANRTGIQLSGCDAGVNKIYNNTITNCGLEFNDTQGAGIFIGGATTNCEVYGNIINNTWEHGIFSYGIGYTYIHDNTINGSGMLSGKTTYAMSNIYHNFNDTAGGSIKIENNNCGSNSDVTNDYKTAIDNTAGVGNNPDNTIINSGKIWTASGVVYKTTDVIIPPPVPSILYFTLDRLNKAATFFFSDGSTQIYTNVDRCVGSNTKSNWTVYFNDKTFKVLKP